LWEMKTSLPATLDECIGDLSSTENRLPDRRSTKAAAASAAIRIRGFWLIQQSAQTTVI
jgi:hypothetical protein